MTWGERVIAVSETVRDYLQRHYPELPATRIQVIPRGVDPAAFPYGYQPSAAWQAHWRQEYPLRSAAPVLTLPGTGPHVVVPASAPPDDPRVLYTLPTFRWQRSGGTDAGAINQVGEGKKTGGISIPTRYGHGPISMVDLNDVQNCIDLLGEYISYK